MFDSIYSPPQPSVIRQYIKVKRSQANRLTPSFSPVGVTGFEPATTRPHRLSVKCSDERSQSLNRRKARERLLLKLMSLRREAEAGARRDNWAMHDSLVRGNAVKKFSGPL